MKDLKITPPEGYEVDTEKSTFEHIVFKPIQKQLPKSWEELETVIGFFTTNNSNVREMHEVLTVSDNKNLFVTEEQAEASLALAQLTQLREVYRQGWKPNWNDDNFKYSIIFYKGSLNADWCIKVNNFLTFQSEEIRDQFLENFKDLIEKASPLLFG